MEKAKSDAQGLVNNVKSKAENVLNDVQQKFVKAKRGELSVPETIHQLRLAHLIILVFQGLVLYLEEGLLSSAFFPFVFLGANLYVVGSRFHQRADSRGDMKGLTGAGNAQVAAKYAVGLFGGFILALLVNMFSPDVDTILGSFFYNMSSYLSVLAGAMTAGFEVYYGAAQH